MLSKNHQHEEIMGRKKSASNGVDSSVVNVDVHWGNVSIGDKIARLGLSVDRSQLKLTTADSQLCERRILVRILAKPPGDESDTGRFPGMEDDVSIEGVAEVKGISSNRKQLSFGLAFGIKGMDVSELAKFAKMHGRLEVVEVLGDASDDDDDGSGDDE